jgi:hypothetical protein
MIPAYSNLYALARAVTWVGRRYHLNQGYQDHEGNCQPEATDEVI